MLDRSFINVELFSEAANNFKKYGSFSNAVPETKDFWDFWDEEERRCKEGYSVGGIRITGDHYAYLNYTNMRMVDAEGRDEVTGDRIGRAGKKIISFPRFWDSDYDFFHVVDIARHGTTLEEYHRLNLGIKIHKNHLRGAKHIICLKSRRKGVSYKVGSMMSNLFFHKEDSKSFAMANGENHLIVDGLLTKTWRLIDFINLHTPYIQPYLINTKMHRKNGYKEVIGGIEVEMGNRGEIMGVSLAGDPQKARGKDGDLGVFEEAGDLPGLFKAWEVAKPGYEDGDVKTGLMMAFGTGGAEDADFEGLQKLFYDPFNNECIAIENQWDEGGQGTFCGFFIPVSISFGSFIDQNGNSDVEGAKAYILEKREEKKRSKDKRSLDQFVAEQPLTPREATLQTTNNLFPSTLLLEQYNRVMAKKLYLNDAAGILFRNEAGKVKFRPDLLREPVLDFPLMGDQSQAGAVIINEAPFLDGKTGTVPKGMYILCHDPYAHDGKSQSPSLGASYVLKMPNNLSLSYHNCIVATWVARPDTQDEYNEQLFLLADYYNCKIDFENERGDVIGYARRHRLLTFLGEEMKMVHKKELASSRTERPYGMHMTEPRKTQGEIYIRDWLMTTVQIMPDGNRRLVLHFIRDPALLQELMKYNKDGNFDRVMALLVGTYAQKEYTHREIESESETDLIAEFFNRDLFVRN